MGLSLIIGSMRTDWLYPGNSTGVDVGFLVPELAEGYLEEGQVLSLCEGPKEVATLTINELHF